MTRILVTGGAGYVGSVSVEAFLAAGHEVVVLDDATTGHPRRGPGRRHVPPGDLHGYRSRRPPAGDGAHRGHPPLRGSIAGRGVRPRPGQVLPRQRGGRRGAPRGGPDDRRRADRVLVDRGGVRRPGRDADPGGRPAPTHQPVRRDEADIRGRPALVRRRLRAAERHPALLQRGRRDRGAGRGPRSGDAPHPQCPRRGRGSSAVDRLRRGLPHARRHVHPRLHPRRRPGRRAPARHRSHRSGRRAHGRATHLQPGHGRRLQHP